MRTCRATFIEARNAFVSAGRTAKIGTYAFGFSWGAVAALFLANVLFCIGVRGERSYGGGRRGWRRNRSVRSRSSYEGRRVKDDYS